MLGPGVLEVNAGSRLASSLDFYSSEIESTMGNLPTAMRQTKIWFIVFIAYSRSQGTRETMAITSDNPLQLDGVTIKLTPFLERALPFARLGIRVFPCDARGKDRLCSRRAEAFVTVASVSCAAVWKPVTKVAHMLRAH